MAPDYNLSAVYPQLRRDGVCDQVIRENPASRGTVTSAEDLSVCVHSSRLTLLRREGRLRKANWEKGIDFRTKAAFTDYSIPDGGDALNDSHQNALQAPFSCSGAGRGAEPQKMIFTGPLVT